MHSHIGQYVSSTAKLPYSKIEEFGIRIEGLPVGTKLKHPSSYGKSVLQAIIQNRENLKLYGKMIALIMRTYSTSQREE